MANEGYHEPVSELSDETRDMHRAIVSLMEELEAVDWYNQRVDGFAGAIPPSTGNSRISSSRKSRSLTIDGIATG